MQNITIPDRALQLAIKNIQLDASLQPSTKDKYIRALQNYVNAGNSLTNVDQLRAYAVEKGITSSTVGFLQAGVNRLAKELMLTAKSSAIPYNITPEKMAMIQAFVMQAEVLLDSVNAEKSKGEKSHTWLTSTQLKELIGFTRENGNTLQEIRDRVALGLLSQGMLRRTEAVTLTFEDLYQSEGYHLLNVLGKGNKTRQVKISFELANDIKIMHERVGDGRILRAMLKRKNQPDGYTLVDDIWVGESISSQAIYAIVQKYGKLLGINLQPHDLRRTGAKIAYQSGLAIEQISLALGHESIETTSLYLGIERNWSLQPADFIPF